MAEGCAEERMLVPACSRFVLFCSKFVLHCSTLVRYVGKVTSVQVVGGRLGAGLGQKAVRKN